MTTEAHPRIAVLCATRRGLRFLERLFALAPGCDIDVWTFPEEPGEPAYFEEIQALASSRAARFVSAKFVGGERYQPFWNPPPDLLLAVSWRYMVPRHVYEKPTRGAFVFHDSLLPEYRGFSPTVWAMLNGEDHTGVTLFEMDESVDAGDIVAQQRVVIGDSDTIATVVDRVTETYLTVLSDNLRGLLAGTAPRQEQDHSRATYVCKRVAADGRIDWGAPAAKIYDMVRALTRPYWGAFTTLDGRPLTVWECRRVETPHEYVGRVPGRVIEVRRGVGAVVLTGDTALLVTRVQLENEVVCAADLITSPSQTLGR